MGLSWGTPNGGNSQKTGQRNANNNASANRQTSNYGGGSSANTGPPSQNFAPDPKPTPPAPSPFEQGQGTVTPAPAPKPTPIYPSPHEQGQGVVTSPAPVPVITTQPNNPVADIPVEVADNKWIQDWAETLESGMQDQFSGNAKLINANTNLIGDNTGAIDNNLDATGKQIKGVQANVDNVQGQVDTANEDLINFQAIQKKLGLNLTDQEGNIVDLERDIITNQNLQVTGQKADQLERNSQDAEVQKALREVGTQFAEQYDTQSSFENQTADDFRLSEDAIAGLLVDMEDAGVEMENINANAQQDIKDVEEKAGEKQKYDQKYWANRLKELERSGVNAQAQLSQEMDVLKDKAYSGDTVVTAEDQIAAWADINSEMYNLGITDAGPAAPKEYMYETFLNNIDQWVKDGKATAETTVSGMLDENTTTVYTLPNGQQVTRKSNSPVITDQYGEDFRFGADTDTLFMDGVELGTKKGNVTTVVKEGYANHVDSKVSVGDDTNPNSAGNRSTGNGGNDSNNDGSGNPTEGTQPIIGDPTDPVVGEDIPLPKDLTDPEGDGAYGQDGQAFSLDGVTFWKRIKDRNGRWTYTRLDSYQNNGTSSRRQSWGKNVQNF